MDRVTFTAHASISDEEADWLLGKLRGVTGERGGGAELAISEISAGTRVLGGERQPVLLSPLAREAVLRVLEQAHLDKQMTEDLRFLELELRRAEKGQ